MKKMIPLDKLLEDIESLNGNKDVKLLLQRFINDELLITDGLIIIKTQGKDVTVDGTRFNEAEAIWALEKCMFKILSGGFSFND